MSAPNGYLSSLVQFMSFLDGVTYTVHDEFTQDRLLEITDVDVVRYFTFKAYGLHEPPGADDYPTRCRANTLAFHKKALSWFMPRANMVWDDVSGRGNPTKSSAVNKFISKVKKHEVRGTGVASQARRAVEWEEFINVLIATREVFSTPGKERAMIFLLAVLSFQWQLIARIDDIMQLATSTILFNYRDPFTLHIKMCWSKNIRTERQSPTQILFPAMDPIVCPLLNIAILMEMVCSEGGLLFGKTNKTAANLLKQVYGSHFFTSQRPGKLGTHSMRKGPATFAARFGCHKDWINQRGRWRGGAQQVDTYIDVFQPYPDARVAGVLCGPRGPCKYAVKEGMVVPVAFLQSIVPHSVEVFGADIAQVLALPLLWAAFEREATYNGVVRRIIPQDLATSIFDRWVSFGFSGRENPVEKIGLAVNQNGDQLLLVPLRAVVIEGAGMPPGAGVTAQPTGTPAAGALAAGSHDGEAFLAQIHMIQSRVDDFKNEICSTLATHKRFMVTMNQNIRRIAIQPVVRSSVNTGAQQSSSLSILRTATSRQVKLTKSPPNLHVLWNEYETGLGGQKAAKFYTDRERGANKCTYSRRKVFWDAVELLIQRNHTAETAIDRIEKAYGHNTSVTKVINEMRRDKKSGIVRF